MAFDPISIASLVINGGGLAYKIMKDRERRERREKIENMLMAAASVGGLAIGAGYLIHKMLKDGNENKPLPENTKGNPNTG